MSGLGRPERDVQAREEVPVAVRGLQAVRGVRHQGRRCELCSWVLGSRSALMGMDQRTTCCSATRATAAGTSTASTHRCSRSPRVRFLAFHSPKAHTRSHPSEMVVPDLRVGHVLLRRALVDRARQAAPPPRRGPLLAVPRPRSQPGRRTNAPEARQGQAKGAGPVRARARAQRDDLGRPRRRTQAHSPPWSCLDRLWPRARRLVDPDRGYHPGGRVQATRSTTEASSSADDERGARDRKSVV